MTAPRHAATATAPSVTEPAAGKISGPVSAPLLPRPDRSTAGLRAAVVRLVPRQLPEMERQMEEALSLAARTGSLAPLTRFLETWAVTVEIARIPSAAARLREAEQTARSVRQNDPAWRTAMDTIGSLQSAARAALEL
ncbi:DUF6247 family protein [Streptomyces sp. NPDC058657]|uniref:DUF6247 family protein n=1 Tax=unclassified Streptomyces TaxID=2593676 RepID=UPI003658F886